MSKVTVLKFGGTSVKNIGRIHHVADVITRVRASKNHKCLVVLSAMGDTTDHLFSLARQCSASPNKRELDLLLATGEQVSIALLALTLRERGINAKSFTGPQIGIQTDNVHNTARILDICRDTLRAALDENEVVVVAGFQGLSEEGEITTLGRGGSDTTAVALAAACDAETCDIYTDVDGIFTTDPNKNDEAQLHDSICYDEVLEMARVGAQVIHPRAVELAKEYQIGVRVRNTFNPEHIGTLINGGSNVEKIRRVTGVAVDGNQALVTFRNVPVDYPFIAVAADKLNQENILVDMVAQTVDESTSQKTVQLSIKYGEADHAVSFLHQLKTECEAGDVNIDLQLAKVSLIGSGLGGSPETSARLLSLLERNGICVKQLYRSELRISCLVSLQSAGQAAELVHREFKLNEIYTPPLELVRSA